MTSKRPDGIPGHPAERDRTDAALDFIAHALAAYMQLVTIVARSQRTHLAGGDVSGIAAEARDAAGICADMTEAARNALGRSKYGVRNQILRQLTVLRTHAQSMAAKGFSDQEG
jgi:hypothetical protein